MKWGVISGGPAFTHTCPPHDPEGNKELKRMRSTQASGIPGQTLLFYTPIKYEINDMFPLYLKTNHDLYSHSTLIAWICYLLLTILFSNLYSFILKNCCQKISF